MHSNRKVLLAPPKATPGGRRNSAYLPSEVAPTLTDFERAYLEKLRNKECPRAVVQFLPTDEVPADADFVFAASSMTPRGDKVAEETWNEAFLGRRGSGPYMDHAESQRLENELTLPKYTSYMKNVSKNIKAFDTTYSDKK